MDFDLLQEQIMIRFWLGNEMTKKQAENNAWIVIDQIKKHMDARNIEANISYWNELTAKAIGII